MRSAIRLLLTVASAAALAALVVAPVEARLSPKSCEARAVTQPFLPWLDSRYYFLLPGGDLESSAAWSLSGGARLRDGNEPFHVTSAADRRSLFLPSGASARSTAICVDSDEPLMRFFVHSTGSPLSMLAVEAHIRTTVLGLTVTTSLPLGIVIGTREWQPSSPVFFKLSPNQLLGGTTTVDFTFTALGLGGRWHVDDVYVDPFKDR
jgi:hypothetical protein